MRHFDPAGCAHPRQRAARDQRPRCVAGYRATYCILAPEDAEDLGYALVQVPHVRVATAGGLIVLPRITLARMEVFGLRRTQVATLVKDLSDSGLEAIIGWSFLDRFRVMIDARRKQLELSAQ